MNIKKILLTAVAKQVKNTAKVAAGAASIWGAYQPQEPKSLKK